MKRLLLIKRYDGKVELQYITCGGRHFGMTQKGRREIGEYKSIIIVDALNPEDMPTDYSLNPELGRTLASLLRGKE